MVTLFSSFILQIFNVRELNTYSLSRHKIFHDDLLHYKHLELQICIIFYIYYTFISTTYFIGTLTLFIIQKEFWLFVDDDFLEYLLNRIRQLCMKIVLMDHLQYTGILIVSPYFPMI